MRHTILAAAFAALALGPTVGFAAPFTSEERTAIAEKIALFDAAFQSGDMRPVMTTIAPRIVTIMASQAGISIDDFNARVLEQIEEMLTIAEILDYSMDLENAQFLEAPSGTPYALVPTRTLMRIDGQVLEASTQSMVFFDEGEVYLGRIDDAGQLGMLTRAYPEFVGITVIAGTMEVIE